MTICMECRFWIPEANNTGYGECRRNAPQPKVTGQQGSVGAFSFLAHWPFTRAVDGCFEGVKASLKVDPDRLENTTGTAFDARVKASRMLRK